MYAYLARDKRVPVERLGSMYAYIGLSHHPFHRLMYNQNREPGWRVGSKSTKCIAPNWQLEMVIGPFMGFGGEQFKERWRKGARRFRHRIRFGIEQSRKLNLRVYCRDPDLIRAILQE